MKHETKEERKNAIGIAFSGGGLQGVAEIGAIEALNELGIRPRYVSGTSFGSSIAALMAMGCTPDEMKEFMETRIGKIADFRVSRLLKELASLKLRGDRDGIKDSRMISDAIKEMMDKKGIRDFHDLPINLSVCTNDTLSMKECIFTTYDEGLADDNLCYLTDAPLETAVRASMSFPGLYTSCDYKGYNFVDGGSKDNLPVRILRDMGVGRVLGITFDISGYTPEKGFDGMLKVAFRALDLYSVDGTKRSEKMADYCVEIKNSDAAIFSMSSLDKTIREGYDCVMAHKDNLLRIFVDNM